jgi:hypothetical protein
MGILDDAIREHLELRRQHGAPEEEVERQKEEALGRTSRARSAQEALERQQAGEDARLAGAPAAEDSAGSAGEAETRKSPEWTGPAGSRPEGRSFDPDSDPESDPGAGGFAPDSDPGALQAEELEPDEVLPEESLEPEPQPHDLRVEDTSLSNGADRGHSSAPEVDEDVLEETPEFLEETPEQDRLWFEQKPPKDFDFGD